MLEYDPSKVDDEYWNVEYLHYATWRVERKNFEWTIYCDFETANKVREENTLKQIWRVMQDKWYKIKEFDEKNEKIKDLEESVDYKNSTIRLRESKIQELEKQIDELKSLPPVKVETIHNDWDIYPADDPRSKFYKEKFDEKLNENLTENKKRWRSTWEK